MAGTPYQFLLDLLLTIEVTDSNIDLVDFISRYQPVLPQTDTFIDIVNFNEHLNRNAGTKDI